MNGFYYYFFLKHGLLERYLHFSQRVMFMEDPCSIKIAGVPLVDFIPQVIYRPNPSGPDKAEVNER